MTTRIRRLLMVPVIIVTVLAAAIGVLYACPLDDTGLRPEPRSLSFAQAVAHIDARYQAERAEPRIRTECRSFALLHAAATAKAVLLLHGYLGCPQQFDGLAEMFYARGYNVHVPLLPRHGTTDPDADRELTASELTAFAGSAMDITAALGREAGVVGASAGGVLAAWLTTTRPGQVRRLLMVAPFFEPGAEQFPPVLVKPFISLYGQRILPDRRHPVGFDYAVLAEFLRLSRLLDTRAELSALASVAVVTSARDRFIDRERARTVALEMSAANTLVPASYEIPPEARIGHEAVDPARLGAEAAVLYPKYVNLYEGRLP
ncbi:alpha/beta hydrolase [Paractinoplanes hotanensis]|uniref:Alpha/beta fold hydrolase n=1 Tax=Paractinoplanes hotanensis TaxID=2906497 RepID=A0ABT0YDY6_9ACTN|nr:alpha/beta fold hydrolase [Actinoplanes hotanensis]MCM4084268.1 alpha/beta fold hydrolase [Actinoplanes hotanensis]